MSNVGMSRRKFTKTGAVAAAGFVLTAAHHRKVLGANDRVRIGCIGVANRGRQLIDAFGQHKDAEIVALCDVDRTALERANALVGGKAQLLGDFRKLLDARDIDAVVIATPDHWHALQMIAACRADKDVYVEKPLSKTLHEGRRMVEVARETKRVVQVGTQRRSNPLYAEAARYFQEGNIGKVTVCRGYWASNMWPDGMGKAAPSEPPATLDWDMWLGPRPKRPYQATIAPYKFRWWHLYSSQIANQGVHCLDAIRWFTGDLAPRRIAALGGRFAVDDDRTIPDTMEVTFECPTGRLIVFGVYEASGNPPLPPPAWVELRGTLGTALAADGMIEIVPERGGQFQDRKPRMKPATLKPADEAIAGKRNANLVLTARHARNFLDCIKTRERPNADVEIGHRSTSFSLLANIALATRSVLEWDAENQTILSPQAANEHLHYEYRKPWTLD